MPEFLPALAANVLTGKTMIAADLSSGCVCKPEKFFVLEQLTVQIKLG